MYGVGSYQIQSIEGIENVDVFQKTVRYEIVDEKTGNKTVCQIDFTSTIS